MCAESNGLALRHGTSSAVTAQVVVNSMAGRPRLRFIAGIVLSLECGSDLQEELSIVKEEEEKEPPQPTHASMIACKTQASHANRQPSTSNVPLGQALPVG